MLKTSLITTWQIYLNYKHRYEVYETKIPEERFSTYKDREFYEHDDLETFDLSNLISTDMSIDQSIEKYMNKCYK